MIFFSFFFLNVSSSNVKLSNLTQIQLTSRQNIVPLYCSFFGIVTGEDHVMKSQIVTSNLLKMSLYI